MSKRPHNIHEHFDEQISLSKTYAEDGAFMSAARVLEELAGDLRRHGDWVNGQVAAQMLEQGKEGA